MNSIAPTTTVKPAVLVNEYPFYDRAGNRGQRIRLRFVCGHEEEFLSLDLGRRNGIKWKPRTNRQLIDDHLRITCPMAYKLCEACAEAAAPKVEGKTRSEWQAIARSHDWNLKVCEYGDCRQLAVYVTSDQYIDPLRFRCWDHAPKDGEPA